jgi:integrase
MPTLAARGLECETLGSVFKRVRKGWTKRQIEDAPYYVKFKLPDGRWARESSETTDFRAAKEKLGEKESEIRNGKYAKGSERFSVTAEAWLKDYSAIRLRSHAHNDLRYRKHLRAAFGAKQLRNIRPADIKAFASDKIREGLSPATVRRILALLRVILNHAVADDKLGESPFRRVSKNVLPRETHGRLDFYTDEEVASILDAAPPTERPFYAVLFHAGLRLGEACGARWSDLDLDARMMTVERSWDHPSTVGRASTKSGNARQVPISKALAPILAAWKANCPKTDDGLAFPAPRPHRPEGGGPATVYVMREARSTQQTFERLCASAGVRHLGLHAARHTFAAAFVRAGGSLYHLQAVMGHSVPTLTMRYAHLVGNDTRPGMDRVRFAAKPSKVIGIGPARKRRTGTKAGTDGAPHGAPAVGGGK